MTAKQQMEFHSSIVLQEWSRYVSTLEGSSTITAVDGRNLDLASIVAVARNHAPVTIQEHIRTRLANSTNALRASIERGETIYGVNTGFGGSADTRTTQVEELQRVLMRELHYGILAPSSGHQDATLHHNGEQRESKNLSALQSSLPCEDGEATTCMPESWTRATILIRINSLISGYSGVRPVIVDRMLDLLHDDITPRVPLRGSISASGDLSPLSYIGGAIMGKPTLEVFVGPRRGQSPRRCTTARLALLEKNLTPVRIAAKETLAIVNGTATSCAVGALAIHDVHGLAVLSQVLTAMSVEALLGTDESFDPFIAQVRPHPGQIEAARNIRFFLQGSKLVAHNDGSEVGMLRQDRYSIRTASQWLGPVLEDLVLAHHQLVVEANSVTDNPIIDVNGQSLNGGNFQAKAVTSAMEKARHALQTIGRMLFAQCTEIINPATNRGLPPNLVADDPDMTFIFKGVGDIGSAALVSELGFLASPVGVHVQTAEMGNQALNSLALIAARYTHTAANVLAMLAATHLLSLCQALDLRAMNIRFFQTLEPEFRDLTRRYFPSALEKGTVYSELWKQVLKQFDATTSMSADVRFEAIVRSLRSTLLDTVIDGFVSNEATGPAVLLHSLTNWISEAATLMLDTYRTNRDAYFLNGDASPLLGNGTRRMYKVVRETLEVPFLHTAILRSPAEYEIADEDMPNGGVAGVNGVDPTEESSPSTVGSYVTKIHEAIRNGSLFMPAMDSLKDACSQKAG